MINRSASLLAALFLSCVSIFAQSVPFGMVKGESTSGQNISVAVPGGKTIEVLFPSAVEEFIESDHSLVARLARPVSISEISINCPEGCFVSALSDSLFRMGVSMVSEKNAAENLAAEYKGFDEMKAEVKKRWNAFDSKFELKGGNSETFIQNYHLALTSYGVTSDVNGDYVGKDGVIGKVPCGRRTYAAFSEPDFRSPDIQLIALVCPDIASDIAATYLLKDSYGAALIAPGAYFFGADGFNAQAFLKLLLRETGDEARNASRGEKEAMEDLAVSAFAYDPCDDVFGVWGLNEKIEKYEGPREFAVPELADAKGSAYVFRALGLYPDIPGEGSFKVLEPAFRKVSCILGGNRISVRRGIKGSSVINGKNYGDRVALSDFVPPTKWTLMKGNRALWVDTYMANGGHGFEASNVFAGVTCPFGMVQMTASPFDYLTNMGFVANQVNGTGGPNMGNFPMLPLKGRLDCSPERMMNFTVPVSDEAGHPGYYSAMVQHDTKAEFTTTTRTGISRITYSPEEETGTVIIGTGVSSVAPSEGRQMLSYGHITGPRSCEGWAVGTSFCGIPTEYKVYFVAEFDRDAFETGSWEKNVLKKGGTEASGDDSGLYFSFDIQGGHQICYKLALSYVSMDNARLNLKEENPDWDFDAVQASCEKSWDKYLSLIDVKGTDPLRKRQMYMHLYHALMSPNVFNDVNGEYMGSDWQVHKTVSTQYELFSNWDTYRTQIQLISMLLPQVASDIVRSHLDFAVQCGDAFPRWAMANVETGIMQGDPSSLLVSNAWAFGARDFDAAKALAIMRHGAETPGLKCQNFEVRPWLQEIFDKGFCKPSLQLEYSSADFAISQFALNALGDKAVSKEYLSRAQAWKNLYNPENGWLQNRNEDGSWKQFDYGWGDYMEASYQAYFWMVPFNINALISLIGEEKAEQRLDEHLSRLDANIFQDWFAICNEPSFQIPWTYNYLGKPWKVSEAINRILNESFSYTYMGLPGNDDVGAMAAWWIFASSGMYPFIPGTGGFTLNTPVFKEVKMHLPGGDLVIKGGSEKNIYTSSLKVDGEDFNRSWIEWDRLKNGACLKYRTSSKPGSSWAADYCPPSFDAPLNL